MDEQTLSEPTSTEMRVLEEALLNPRVRSSPEMLERLLAEDFVEFRASGQACDKQQIMADLPQQPEEEFAVEDFRIRPLAPGVILATYRVARRRNPTGAAPYSLRSSIWKYQQGRWQMVFHQGTPMCQSGDGMGGEGQRG